MEGLTWLHLSDWHQEGKEFERMKVRDALMEDISRRVTISRNLANIEFVAFSGDIAYHGTAEEYNTAADQFFTPLLDAANVGRDRLFIVPGNHDLERAALELLPGDLPEKLSSPDRVNDWLTNERKRRILLEPFAAYSRFIKDYLGQDIAGSEPAYSYVRCFEAARRKIAVIGLNSAWLCARNRDAKGEVNDRGYLILGEPQVYSALAAAEGADIRIVVFHHPFDWLGESDQRWAEERLGRQCHFILRGHQHLPQCHLVRGTAGEFVIIPAGASYDRASFASPYYSNAYNFVHIDFDLGQGVAYFRRWSERQSRWVGDEETRESGQFMFPLPEGLGREKKASDVTSAQSDVNDSAYRRWLINETDWIDIRGVGLGVGIREAHRFPMLALYTELHVSEEFGETGTRRMPLRKVIAENRCTTIEGLPGSGKTTFLRYLSRIYADDSTQLPLLLSLTDLYDYVTENSSHFIGPSWRWLINYWLRRSEAFGWGFTEPWLRKQLESGKTLMLLDGLDELPTGDVRARIVRIMDDAARYFSRCHWVVTSRPGVLTGMAIPLDFATYVIDDLTDEDIRVFVNSWAKLLFRSMPGDSAASSQEIQYEADLFRAIRNHREVHHLARTPVMLTAIAVVHWNERKLPEGRAALYESVIQWLIRSRRDRANRMDETTTRRCYQHLALAMFQHPQGRQTVAGRGWAAETISMWVNNDKEAALRFLDQEEMDSGIIVRRGVGDIAFWHLSFQEYLAACEIAAKTDVPESGWWSVIRGRLNDPDWAEVIRFVPVILLKLGNERVDMFINNVLQTRKDDSLAENARVVGTLGCVLFDLAVFGFSAERIPHYAQVRDQVMQIFSERGSEVDLPTCYGAAVALGRSGDPRLLKPEENWIRVPAGMLWIGAQGTDPSQPNYDESAVNNEQPVHQVYASSFEIGRYPVTVQEFGRFVEDCGYEKQELWESVGWQWRVRSRVSSPTHWDRQLSYPNCPVVYISWYEAQAYCKWLTMQDDNMSYRLPTEAEWEYVARRGQDANPTYTRYCFGDTLSDEINWEYCGLEALAPVGLFPMDTSFDGVMDMNGNVMEWMQDPGVFDYSSGPIPASLINERPSDFRATRGGSWREMADNCRSASRKWFVPQISAKDIGFRVLRKRKQIPIKGKLPIKGYHSTLADEYARYKGKVYSLEETDQVLSGYADRLPGLRAGIILRLFPEEVVLAHRPFQRLPCTMGDVPTKLDFNLLYQDTRLKLAIEEKLGATRQSADYEQDAQDLMHAVSVLLCTSTPHKHALWTALTDNDLDALIYLVLDLYDPKRRERLLADGYHNNQLAIAGLPPLAELSLEELIRYQVFAGTVWWSERQPLLEDQFPGRRKLEIDDVSKFRHAVLDQVCNLVFFFDDNGELVWDLALIQRLLTENPNLRVIGVITTHVLGNDANAFTLERCLEYPAFRVLLEFKACKRFQVFEEDNLRSSIDPGFCSQNLLDILESADVAFVKGVSFFETMQKLPIDTYYAFVVHSADSQTCTGLRKGDGVFVRIPKGKAGYHYRQQTLREVYLELKQSE